MSRRRALDALAGRKLDRVAQLEFLSHEAFFRAATGIDPRDRLVDCYLAYLERFDIDATLFVIGGATGLAADEVARDEHHARTLWGMRETHWLTDPPCETPEQILAYDPRTADPAGLAERTDRTCKNVAETQALLAGRALLVPGQYQLVLHYMPFACDWQVFMELLATDADACLPLLDRCMEFSIDVFTALAASEAPMIIAHEDLCSARGPIFNPDFLRREVFPRFARIYEPVKRAGKKVLAISDGLVEAIAPDLLAAGADGVFIEPMNDIDRMIDAVGPEGVIMGAGNTGVLTTGTAETVAAETAASLEKAKRLPGFFFGLAGEAPQNVPVENLEAYFETCREHRTV